MPILIKTDSDWLQSDFFFGHDLTKTNLAIVFFQLETRDFSK